MKKTCFLAILTVLCLLSASLALAASTAPFSLKEEDNNVKSTQANGKLDVPTNTRMYRGITVSDQWVYQLRLDSLSFKLRLFEKNGTGVMFREMLGKASDGEGVALVLRQIDKKGGRLLQFDQKVIDRLKKVNITEIILVDADDYIQNTYEVALLDTIRSMLELRDGEELSISGLEDPVSVVDENGVRRILSE